MIKKIFCKLPSIVWIFLIPLALGGLVLTLVGGFYLLTHVEGVASLLVLAVALFIFGAYAFGPVKPFSAPENSNGFFIGLGLSFFALMGMTIDQTGNILYNKPIEMIFCGEETHFNRTERVLHPLPGRTDVLQDFSCRSTDELVITKVNTGWVMGIRFFEYVILGYILGGIAGFIRKKRQKRAEVLAHLGP